MNLVKDLEIATAPMGGAGGMVKAMPLGAMKGAQLFMPDDEEGADGRNHVEIIGVITASENVGDLTRFSRAGPIPLGVNVPGMFVISGAFIFASVTPKPALTKDAAPEFDVILHSDGAFRLQA